MDSERGIRSELGGDGMMNKPPIGTSPCWFALSSRIEDLADAISRYAEHCMLGCDKRRTTKLMREWAREIICHCDTIDRLQDIKEETDE